MCVSVWHSLCRGRIEIVFGSGKPGPGLGVVVVAVVDEGGRNLVASVAS